MNKSIKINGVSIGEKFPPYIVAEMSANHNGDINNALQIIKSAKENTDIKGIRLRSDYINAGWPQTRSIRNALNNFKKTGKFIYAYGDFFTQKGYYLSSIADSISPRVAIPVETITGCLRDPILRM